jgi:hypothetical protein
MVKDRALVLAKNYITTAITQNNLIKTTSEVYLLKKPFYEGLNLIGRKPCSTPLSILL